MGALDIEDKLVLLGQAARHDICGGASFAPRRRPGRRRKVPPGIYPAVLPNGRVACLFKVLLTNSCANDCAYCQNRLGGPGPEASFSPDELARAFVELHRCGLAHGLFLSSGIPDKPDAVMQRMIDTLEILRTRYAYTGYIHVKVLPGASREAVEKACRLADRASVNLEFPNPHRLADASRSKDFHGDLLTRLSWLGEIHRGGLLGSGLTTQFVVGACGESDAEIINTLSELYRRHSLRRAYFSSFNPLPGTPWEDRPPASTLREHRLYQADFLHRLYGFDLEEIPLDDEGHLYRDRDPKMAWALAHPEFFPVEINEAGEQSLLRVPGMGVVSARRIISARRQKKMQDVQQLRKLGVVVSRAAPFILLGGRCPPRSTLPPASPRQLVLWEQC